MRDMGRGEMLLRSKKTYEERGSGDGWVDGWERYGLALECGSTVRLLSPAPRKQPQGVSVTGSHGVSYDGGTIGASDERQFSFDVHLRAESVAEYLRRYELFCEEILAGQYFQLRVSPKLGRVYHLLYRSAEPVRKYFGKFGVFSLTVTEPHPEIEDARVEPFGKLRN